MKLITKIVGATLGLAMAIGVGVGVATNNRVATGLKADGENYASVDDTFELASSISDGDEIIIAAKNYSKAMSAQGTNIRNTGSITKSQDESTATIDSADSVVLLTVGVSTISQTQYFTFNDGTGFLNNNSQTKSGSNQNYLTTVDNLDLESGKTHWTVSFSNGVASLVSLGQRVGTGRYTMSYNYNNGSDRFSCYTGIQGTGQLAIYRRVAGDAPTTYSVTYHDNNKTSGSVPTDSTRYETGDSITVAGNTGDLARTGYTWSGWSLNQDGSGTAYGPTYTQTYTVETANINFYPIWVKNVTPLPASGTFSITGTNPNFGSYGTDVAYTIEEDNTPDSEFGLKCTNVTKNSGNIQFKATTGVLYSTTPLSYLRNVVVSGANNSDAVVTYGTSENSGCTESNIGTRNTYFKVANSASNARYWTITVTYALEDPAELTDIVITAGADSVRKTYDDGEVFDPTGLVIKAEWNHVLDDEHDVSADVVWTPEPLTAGTTSVTGTYTSGPNSATVTVNGLTVSAPDFVHTYASNSVYNQTSGSSSVERTYTPTSGPEYVTLGGYNYSGSEGCMSFLNADGMYLGNNEEYSVASVKKYIRKMVITTTANVTSSLTMTEGQTALPTSSPVVPTASADNKTLTYVFSNNVSFFKLTKAGTSYVNLKSISVYLGANLPVVSSVSASLKAGTYYAGTTLSASDFNVTVGWTGGKADTHPTEGFTWTVNGVLNGVLSERDDNKVVVTYENVASAEFDVVGAPALAKDIIKTYSTQSALTYHYSKTVNTVNNDLNKTFTGRTGTGYGNWENTTAYDVSYKGNSAAGNDAIQLRTSDNSGIVTSANTNNRLARNVTISWNSNTSNGRKVEVYGKNGAYTASSDLYDDGEKGTLIGTITKGTTTSLTINGDYKFLGFKANGGALWMDTLTITWSDSVSYVYSNAAVKFGGQVSKILWNRLNTESTIVGYGVMLAEPSQLGDDSIEEWYDVFKGVDFENSFETISGTSYLKETSIKNFYNPVSTTPTESGDYYIWNLVKGVNGTDIGLTRRYTAVAYVRIADDEIIFLNETTKSAAQIAAELIAANPSIDDTLEGSMANLASKYVAA